MEDVGDVIGTIFLIVVVGFAVWMFSSMYEYGKANDVVREQYCAPLCAQGETPDVTRSGGKFVCSCERTVSK
jgi:hypothetical protein